MDVKLPFCPPFLSVQIRLNISEREFNDKNQFLRRYRNVLNRDLHYITLIDFTTDCKSKTEIEIMEIPGKLSTNATAKYTAVNHDLS